MSKVYCTDVHISMYRCPHFNVVMSNFQSCIQFMSSWILSCQHTILTPLCVHYNVLIPTFTIVHCNVVMATIYCMHVQIAVYRCPHHNVDSTFQCSDVPIAMYRCPHSKVASSSCLLELLVASTPYWQLHIAMYRCPHCKVEKLHQVLVSSNS